MTADPVLPHAFQNRERQHQKLLLAVYFKRKELVKVGSTVSQAQLGRKYLKKAFFIA